MKKIITVFIFTMSLTSFSANAMQAVGITFIGTSLYGSTVVDALCNLAGGCKEAIQIVQDTQDYNQTGILSAFLEQKIQETKASNQNLSDEDALDAVVASALAQLK